MRVYNLPHSDGVLKGICIEPLNLTATEVALSASRKILVGDRMDCSR